MRDQKKTLSVPFTTAGIPRSLAACFQEFDLERLDPAQHADLVIERVLAYGDRRELRWLWQIGLLAALGVVVTAWNLMLRS